MHTRTHTHHEYIYIYRWMVEFIIGIRNYAPFTRHEDQSLIKCKHLLQVIWVRESLKMYTSIISH